ncbi:MAG: hypothetical protein Q9215_001403 [Flavoplaca cf. flavocitrina]
MNASTLSSIPPEVYEQDRGPGLVIIIWVFASLALATVTIRLWTRFKFLHRSGPEDFLILSALINSLIWGAILTASVRQGLGVHTYALDPSRVSMALKLYAISVPFGLMLLGLPTVALAIVLNNLIASTKRHTCIIFALPILRLVLAFVEIVLLFTLCKPVSTLWNPQPGAKCRSPLFAIRFLYFLSAFGAFVDVFLAVVPLVAYWKLQIRQKAKVVLFLVMGATVLAAICALVRLAYITSPSAWQDYTYISINHTKCAVIEGNLIIMAACIPGLRPFVKHVRSRFRKIHRPQPLQLHPKASQLDSSIASTALPSPLSLRRMEPRSSGSVSGSVPTPSLIAYRQNSLARLESIVVAMEEADIGQQQDHRKGKEKVDIKRIGEENGERRGRTGGLEAGEAVEIDERDIGTVGDVERDDQIQELREILDEDRVEDRQSWLIKMRERVDKRMTI